MPPPSSATTPALPTSSTTSSSSRRSPSTGCAGSTDRPRLPPRSPVSDTPRDASGAPPAEAFDVGRPWRRHPRVAIRPEPFGGLAYHYDSRRLTFLRDPALVTLVDALGSCPDVETALATTGIPERRRPAFVRALATLAESGFIEPLDAAGSPTSAEPARPRGCP
ncbi:MAG: mycofactocin biosynthesis chaperone MftB [Actinomyces sp.]|nr:MAG: mycofactocin biosynthesis chaperone MftB [Actinomyces sp.]